MSALEQIRERIKNEPDNLNLLNLSEIKITNFTDEIKKELERFKKVKVLMLRQCDLDNLDNLPNWKLSAVDLSENRYEYYSCRFNDDIINKLATIPSLTQILLMECDIRSLDNLKQLGPLKSLQELDFTNCPVTQTPNYRPTLFDRYLINHSASRVLKFSINTTSMGNLWLTKKMNLMNPNTMKMRKAPMRRTMKKMKNKRAMTNPERKNDSSLVYRNSNSIRFKYSLIMDDNQKELNIAWSSETGHSVDMAR